MNRKDYDHTGSPLERAIIAVLLGIILVFAIVELSWRMWQ